MDGAQGLRQAELVLQDAHEGREVVVEAVGTRPLLRDAEVGCIAVHCLEQITFRNWKNQYVHPWGSDRSILDFP